MTVRYVRSTDGSNSDTGATWALAKATLSGADAIDAAGDTLWVSQVHSESTASAVTLALAGTAASPTKLLCGNDGAEPPTALATGAICATTGVSNYVVNGNVYCYGLTLKAGSAANAANPGGASTAGHKQVWESCEFWITNTSAASAIVFPNAAATVRWINCNVKFGAVGQKIQPAIGGYLSWNGGAMVAGSSTPTVLFDPSLSGTRILVENVDLSAFAATMNLSNSPTPSGICTLRNCKPPGSWSGTLLNGSFTATGSRLSMYNCDSAPTNYKVWVETFEGSIRDETTIVRTGGASDGTTGLAWKMAANANAIYPLLPLASDEFAIWNSTTGSPKTVTVEYLHDTNVAAGQGAGASNAFQNNEVWLEAEYLGTSGFPIGSHISSAPADVNTAAADNAGGVGTSGWTTTGLTTPKSGKVSVTFTPQKVGYVRVKVMIGKASKTIYVDPKITVA